MWAIPEDAFKQAGGASLVMAFWAGRDWNSIIANQIKVHPDGLVLEPERVSGP